MGDSKERLTIDFDIIKYKYEKADIMKVLSIIDSLHKVTNSGQKIFWLRCLKTVFF